MNHRLKRMVREHVAVEVEQGIFRANVDVSKYEFTAKDIEFYADQGFSRAEISEMESRVRDGLLLIKGVKR